MAAGAPQGRTRGRQSHHQEMTPATEITIKKSRVLELWKYEVTKAALCVGIDMVQGWHCAPSRGWSSSQDQMPKLGQGEKGNTGWGESLEIKSCGGAQHLHQNTVCAIIICSSTTFFCAKSKADSQTDRHQEPVDVVVSLSVLVWSVLLGRHLWLLLKVLPTSANKGQLPLTTTSKTTFHF